MNKHTALKKLSKLTKAQADHLLTQLKQGLKEYEACIVNYPPDRMANNGVPYRDHLMAEIAQVQQRICELNGVDPAGSGARLENV